MIDRLTLRSVSWRRAALAAGLAAAIGAAPALAQRKPPEPAKKEEPAAAEQPKVDVEGKGAILQGLDKVTGRVSTLEADINKPVTFRTLEITVRRCQRSRPDQKLERAAFLEIDYTDPATKQKRRVFSGWMFASNPAISAMEHAVYDVWVKDCK